MAAAERLGFDGPGVFHPAEMIDVVNVEIAVTTTAQPDEAVEALDLIHQIGERAGVGFGEGGGERAGHAVTAHEDDVADLAVADALVELLHRAAVARHQADADFEVFRGGLRGEIDHPARGRAVGGERLFHEHVELLLDRVGEMHPTKRERRREDGDVAGPQAIHGVLVRVKADELAVLGHVDARGVFAFQRVVSGLQARCEDIGHGDEFDGAGVDGEGVGRRAGAATAAADERDLNRVGALRVYVGQGHAGERRDRGELGAGFQKFTARIEQRSGRGRGRGHEVKVEGSNARSTVGLSPIFFAAERRPLIEDRIKRVKRFFAEVTGIVETAVAVEAVDRGHVGGAEREIKEREIFRESRG